MYHCYIVRRTDRWRDSTVPLWRSPRLEKAQQEQIDRSNAYRQNRVFEVGEKVLVKSSKRLSDKITPLYTEEKVDADLGTTVLIKGRVVHKDNLKSKFPIQLF